LRAQAPTRSERRAQTREALLRSASRLITRQGLERTSIDQIAADAGFTKGAFYANFASKQELFLEMLDLKFAAELERLEAALAGEGEPGSEARNAAEEFISFVWRDPEWPRLFFEFTAYAARDEEFREQLADRYGALRARIADLYRRWSADFPVEPALPFEDLATITFCMSNGYLMEQLIEPGLGDELYATMVAAFFRGVQALSAGWEPAEADAGQPAEAQAGSDSPAARRRSSGAGR